MNCWSDLALNSILCKIAAFDNIDLPKPRGSILHILAPGLVLINLLATSVWKSGEALLLRKSLGKNALPKYIKSEYELDSTSSACFISDGDGFILKLPTLSNL
jgi:hypothetical protein